MVLDPTKAGIYGARITQKSNKDKTFGMTGPQFIQFDKDTCQFHITMEKPSEDVWYASDPKILEIYTRNTQIDKIQYGVEQKKIIARDFASLQCVLKLPMELLPDPRVIREDAADQEKFERELKERAERAAEEKKIREAQEAAKKEEKEKKRQARIEAMEAEKQGKGDDGSDDLDEDGSDVDSDSQGNRTSQKKGKSGSVGRTTSKAGKSMLGSDEDMEDFEDEGIDDEGYDNNIGDLPSQPVMKRELIQAIHDEMHEYQELKRQNEEFQKEIILMEYTGKDPEKQTDQMLHEHKYLNTLANVHQVRYNLKET